MEIEEREGDRAQVMDFETSYKVTRVAQANPMPEKLLSTLKDQYRNLRLKYGDMLEAGLSNASGMPV